MGTPSVAQDSSAPARRISLPVDDAMVGASSGWYYDPEDEAVYRWFDGEAWTDHCTDIFVSESPIETEAERTNDLTSPTRRVD